jgi:hypothetical protein
MEETQEMQAYRVTARPRSPTSRRKGLALHNVTQTEFHADRFHADKQVLISVSFFLFMGSTCAIDRALSVSRGIFVRCECGRISCVQCAVCIPGPMPKETLRFGCFSIESAIQPDHNIGPDTKNHTPTRTPMTSMLMSTSAEWLRLVHSSGSGTQQQRGRPQQQRSIECVACGKVCVPSSDSKKFLRCSGSSLW